MITANEFWLYVLLGFWVAAALGFVVSVIRGLTRCHPSPPYDDDLDHYCGDCGRKMQIVRPGKWQCPICE